MVGKPRPRPNQTTTRTHVAKWHGVTVERTKRCAELIRDSSRLVCEREVVQCGWEAQVARMRAEPHQPPVRPSKTTRAKREAISVASVGCVLECPFEVFVLGKVLGGGRKNF